jgi:hypothetical protein
MLRSARAYDGRGALSLGQSMANDRDRHSLRQTKWLSWLTLLAGAVMCVFAVLMS